MSGRISTMRSSSSTIVPPVRTRSGRTRSAPDRTSTRASGLSAPVGVRLQLASRERKSVDRFVVDGEQRAIESLEQPAQLALVRSVHHENTAGLGRRKPAIVQVVAIQGDERTPELMGKL